MKALACSLGNLSKTKKWWLWWWQKRLLTSNILVAWQDWETCLLLLRKHRALKVQSWKKPKTKQQKPNKLPPQQKPPNKQPHHRNKNCLTLDVCKHCVTTSGVSCWRHNFCLHGFCVGWGAQAGGRAMLRQSCSKSLLPGPVLSGRLCLAGDCLRWLAYELLPPCLQVVENFGK